MMLAVNQLICWADEDGGRSERIIWVADDQTAVYAIDITKKSGLPVFYNVEVIEKALQSGEAVWEETDPWCLHVLEEEISDAQRNMRDRAWQAIEKLVGKDNEPAIFMKQQRGAMIAELAAHEQLAVSYIYRNLFRYWQRGMTKNALLPDYSLSGGRGKTRMPGEKKRGRPRKSAVFNEGINLTEDIRATIRKAVKTFYLQTERMSLRQAYQAMLKKHFSEGVYVENGLPKVQLIPENERPSFAQFYQIYLKEFKKSDVIKARSGEREFMRNHRAILGDSTLEANGPGEKYQFDATMADVYLVSRFKRERIIGRPVIYGIIDVFSRMVVGVYIGLEGPSWLGAMMAMAGISQDKVKYCQDYGIPIVEEQWPCRYMPSAFLADRGEMLQENLNSLLESLRIRGENATAYRGDLKGIVERLFRTVQDEMRPMVPGAVRKDFREREGPDYRLDAKLDLAQFTKIVLALIIEHNNTKVLGKYVRDRQMIEEDVKPIPIELWNWGVKNRSGALRWVEEDIIKLNLMPKEKATVTASGILFRKMNYSCELALRERWFEKARQKGTWKIEVSYDPRTINPVYIRHEDGRSYETCRLIERDLRFDGMSLAEVEDLLEYEREMKSDLTKESIDPGVQVRALVEQTVNEAIAETQRVVTGRPKTKKDRLQSIRLNRKEEREQIREKEVFVLDESLKSTEKEKETVKEKEPAETENGEAPDHLLAYLRKKQQERRNK